MRIWIWVGGVRMLLRVTTGGQRMTRWRRCWVRGAVFNAGWESAVGCSVDGAIWIGLRRRGRGRGGRVTVKKWRGFHVFDVVVVILAVNSVQKRRRIGR